MSFPNETKPWRLGFDPEELAERKKQNQTFHLKESGMQFIDHHFGPRPGCLHVLMGSTGRGKSTLVHSLITSWGEKDKILLYITEESFERIESKLAIKNEDMSFLSPKLHLVHERSAIDEIGLRDVKGLMAWLSNQIEESQCKILIIDNITTSAFYEGQFQNTVPIIHGLKNLAEQFQIPILIVAHTKKGVNETTKNLITSDDIRGSASLSMMADYFYIFYRVRKTLSLGSVIDTAIVYVSKSRDHDNQDWVYKLEYSKERKRYYADKLVDFKIFKSLMKERDSG